MNYTADNKTTVPQDLNKLAEKTGGNIYAAITVIAKRANQIEKKMTEDIRNDVQEFVPEVDTLEEEFYNPEQAAVSKYYENLPKPTLIALTEFKHDKLYIGVREDN